MNNNRKVNTTRISTSGSFPGKVPMLLCKTDWWHYNLISRSSVLGFKNPALKILTNIQTVDNKSLSVWFITTWKLKILNSYFTHLPVSTEKFISSFIQTWYTIFPRKRFTSDTGQSGKVTLPYKPLRVQSHKQILPSSMLWNKPADCFSRDALKFCHKIYTRHLGFVRSQETPRTERLGVKSFKTHDTHPL